jgi:hypothetical protein
VIVRDGSPQLTGVWTDASTAGDDCDEFVREFRIWRSKDSR